MLRLYLIFPLSLVAANPILQRIPIQIPAQAWPTQPQTCPTQTCPNVSRPATCQACQNPYRNLFNSHQLVVQQPSNSCPCNKHAVQNTITNQHISPEVLSQLILKRLLSPQPQSQTTVLSAQNPAPNCNPTQNPAPIAKVCNQCEANNPAPNIINNYIILPPEYFKSNETKVNNEDTEIKKRKGKRRRQQNRQRKPKTDPECPCDDELENHNKLIGEQQIAPCPCDKDDIVKNYDFDRVQNSELKPAAKSNTETINDKILPESVAAVAQNAENPQNLQVVSRKAGYTENSPEVMQNTRKSNRGRSKSIEEAIIKDFCKKHPTIPEEIARGLLKKLKQQIESRDIQHYNPYPYSPYSFGEYSPYTYLPMYYPQNKGRQSVQNDRVHADRRSGRRKPKRSERRNKKPKAEAKEDSDNCDSKCEKLVELNPTVINIETETITTEKITATTENKHKELLPVKESETQMETPDDLITQLEQMKEKFVMLNEIESTTVKSNKHIEYPELGKEDKVPTVYNNGVDDYYPDFRGDNIAFYASDEERDIKEDKYHTTDKNRGPDCKNYGKKLSNYNNFNNDSSCEYTLPIPTESYESYEESIKDESEEIRFKIPPPLELPDFETKQINRFPEIIDEFVAEDFRRVKTYSDATADLRIPEIEMKPAKVFTKDKTGRTNIETVFGRSRVIKYGQDSEGAGSDPVITYYLPEEAMTEDRILLPDGEKAVVVAKSIRDLVESWE